jgi:hypothetical protein
MFSNNKCISLVSLGENAVPVKGKANAAPVKANAEPAKKANAAPGKANAAAEN